MEIKIGDMNVAWTEDDGVYVRSEETKSSTREDGFILVGYLDWEDSPDDNDDMEYNLDRLSNFVMEWKQNEN